MNPFVSFCEFGGYTRNSDSLILKWHPQLNSLLVCRSGLGITKYTFILTIVIKLDYILVGGFQPLWQILVKGKDYPILLWKIKIHVWNHQPVLCMNILRLSFFCMSGGTPFCFTPFTPFGSWHPIRSKSPQRRCCRDRWAIALCPSISRHKPRRGTRSSFMAPGDSGVMKLIENDMYNYI